MADGTLAGLILDAEFRSSALFGLKVRVIEIDLARNFVVVEIIDDGESGYEGVGYKIYLRYREPDEEDLELDYFVWANDWSDPDDPSELPFGEFYLQLNKHKDTGVFELH